MPGSGLSAVLSLPRTVAMVPAGHGLPVGEPLQLQLLHGTLFDQQIDQRQPLRFVDRLGQQFSIAIVVKTGILLAHRLPRLRPSLPVFPKPRTGAISRRGMLAVFPGGVFESPQGPERLLAFAGTRLSAFGDTRAVVNNPWRHGVQLFRCC